MTVKFEKKIYAADDIMKEMYKAGYRFYCNGDYKIMDTKDPWSGMPEVDCNTYFFTTEEEANNFAITQRWVFNPEIHAKVYKIKG